ncbi:MAG TPA: exonuclease domain-containing protein, partial [Spirochaetota bacterium]|nr:exonuclease domain-containing protein [Spirochaetota bacterium]
MSWIMVDIESDGPIPGDYSMIEIGAVIVDDRLDTTFYSQIKPISDNYKMESLAVSGYSREDTLSFRNPEEVMLDFKTWILQNSVGKPLFISDNNGFDWMFVCWYFHHFLSDNP